MGVRREESQRGGAIKSQIGWSVKGDIDKSVHLRKIAEKRGVKRQRGNTTKATLRTLHLTVCFTEN